MALALSMTPSSLECSDEDFGRNARRGPAGKRSENRIHFAKMRSALEMVMGMRVGNTGSPTLVLDLKQNGNVPGDFLGVNVTTRLIGQHNDGQSVIKPVAKVRREADD